MKSLEALEALEALDLIDSFVNLDEYDMETHGVNQAFILIKRIIKTLQAPTSDEVCKALSEYFKQNVIYYHNFNSFGYEFSEEKKKYNIKVGNDELRKIYVSNCSRGIEFYCVLPPHLIELIAKFYKKELGEKK